LLAELIVGGGKVAFINYVVEAQCFGGGWHNQATLFPRHAAAAAAGGRNEWKDEA